MVGNEHAGFNEAVLLRMLVRELTMHKETINQWQKEYDRKWDGRSKVRGGWKECKTKTSSAAERERERVPWGISQYGWKLTGPNAYEEMYQTWI